MLLCRSQLFEAESAATLAGAAAGFTNGETDARASELSSEYSGGIEKTRILHRSEHVETKRALDEQICEQKDSIEVMKREALNEASSLKSVIGTLDNKLQSTRRELEQAVDVEIRLRDTMSAEMRETNARSSSNTIPDLLHSSLPFRLTSWHRFKT